MNDRCIVLAMIFFLICSACALDIETSINGEGDFYTWANSNYNQFEEKINGTGFHQYTRNASTDEESSKVRIGYLYRNPISGKENGNNLSTHFVSASSIMGLEHSVSSSSNKTTLFKATIKSDAISLSTDYYIQMKLGNISERISYTNIEEAELLPTGPMYQSESNLKGNYTFASKLNENRPDLIQRDDLSELVYQIDAVALMGYRNVTEYKAWERPIRTVNGVALPSNETANIYLGYAIELVESADKEINESNKSLLYKLALENLSNAISENPGSYEAHMVIGYVYGQQNNADKAIKAFDSAIAIQETVDAYISKAMIQDEKLNDSYGASISYRKAAELDPTDYMIRTNLAANLINIEDYKGAIDECDIALEINDRDQDAWYLKGYAHYYLGQDEDAKKALKKAIDLGPETDAGLEAKMTLESIESNTISGQNNTTIQI